MSGDSAVLDLCWPHGLRLSSCVQALEAFEPMVARAVKRGQKVQCRLVGWGPVDTSALAVLLALRRVAIRAGAEIEFLEPPEALKALARMSQVDGLLSFR